MTVKITKPAINLREILSGIEPNATADQAPAEIKTAYESNSDTNAFTDSDKTKLDGIEQNATADQTGAEIKAAYEGEADTNAFTDTLLNKLNGIETGADVTDATNVTAAGALMDADYADGKYLVGTATPGTYTQVTDNSTDWNTAYSWGDHSTAGYITNGLHLGELHDVLLSSETGGDVLKYDGTKWVNSSLADAGIQPLDADLTAIAALDSADGNIIVGSASGWVAESGATARASLGLVIGTDVQAYDVDTAKLDVAQSFTAAQRGSTFTATATGSTTYNFSENQNFVLTLSGNLTLANPTTEAVGQSGFFVFIQPSTGGPYTVSLGTEFQTVGGAGLTLSTAANAVDVVPYIVQASGKILLGTPQLAFA